MNEKFNNNNNETNLKTAEVKLKRMITGRAIKAEA